MARPRIVVVGSVNTDMVVLGQRIPAPGETVLGGRFVMAAGGKGANQAVAAARLGAEVALVARVGDDLFGRESIDRFVREGIATDFIFRDPAQATGVALILVDAAGENSISVAPGANSALSPEDVEAAWTRMGPVDAVLLQLEIPLPTVACAVRRAASSGARVILDPAPAAPLDDSVLADVDCLTPNETEASQLTGIEVVDEPSARAAAKALLARGAKRVIITRGAAGSLVCTSEGSTHVPCPSVEAVDTTAAGDAFNGGLAFAWTSDRSLVDAAAYASRVAALSVTKSGAQPSLPTADQVAQFEPR